MATRGQAIAGTGIGNIHLAAGLMIWPNATISGLSRLPSKRTTSRKGIYTLTWQSLPAALTL
ncbi:hypothetical protein KFU94_57550 [Chloroflexi bacterium TSY]|nr:hypothetical protein [Chloroflexi bacterium TSY]